MAWQPSDEGTDQLTLGQKLVEEYQIKRQTSCSVCHR